jgi:hypothetical protein
MFTFSLDILNFVISGLTLVFSLFGCRYHIWRFEAWMFTSTVVSFVVRNTIFRKAPPSVVSGYGERSINLNKVVATFEKHTFLSQIDLTRTGIISNSFFFQNLTLGYMTIHKAWIKWIYYTHVYKGQCLGVLDLLIWIYLQK